MVIKTIQLNHGEMSAPVTNALILDDRFDLLDTINPTSLKKLKQLLLIYKPDLLVIASYLKIIPADILQLVPKIINVHFGDLPRQKGGASLPWAIINLYPAITMSIHEVIPELDSGNIIHKKRFNISKKSTIISVYEEINKYLFDNITNICWNYYYDCNILTKQDISKTTYNCTRIPKDGLIDWNNNYSYQIDALTRALLPPILPGAYTYYKNQKIIILETSMKDLVGYKYENKIPGRIIKIHKEFGVEVFTKDSSIILTKIIYKNKEYRADEIIKSIRQSLGIDLELLLNNE